MQPVLSNRYRRRYFRTADDAIRLTVDWGLEFVDLRGVRASLSPLSGQDHGVIAEVKYADTWAIDAAAVTAGFPFRLVRCSKYVLGVQRLGRMSDCGACF
ncbi:MAG TPA: hypothetical protein PLY00_03995 [Verrucomicrobiota bacterium]|nr:hypothetical protein [Verrucomicrobiota bacterium]HOF47408.1 hypothetical protein [Verrucomicrobiota bacterium]HOR70437.1 hypothetical protein [Verrucomicrobiota bacterium]HPW79735.1 hypothetical protein [Verrucomicrobiota bacterium]HQA40136.1 hypothetical protein [Verrucomicrobiota bacterium]